MKITKTMTEAIAQKESDKKYNEKISDSEKNLRSLAEKEFLKTFKIKIPQEIIDSGYIRMEQTLAFRMYGENRKVEVEMYNPYPCKINAYDHEIIPSKGLEAMFLDLKKLREDRLKFRRELQTTIGSFTTHAALLVHIPELKPHFADVDIAKSMAIVPVEKIKEIRKQLVKE